VTITITPQTGMPITESFTAPETFTDRMIPLA